MIEQDYILLILNCKKYKYKSDHQKNTWLKNIPSSLIYYHIIGDETLTEEFMFDDKNNILYLKTKDDYNSLPHKVISAFNAIKTKYKFKYIFKTDDDQELIKPDFFKILMNLLETKKETHYGGYSINCREHISQYYIEHPELPKNILLKKTIYCNGRFYLLSSEAVNNLLIKKTLIEKEYLEDYAIGFYLDDMYKQKLLYIDNGTIFKDILFVNT
jgi:hypothetical protein